MIAVQTICDKKLPAEMPLLLGISQDFRWSSYDREGVRADVVNKNENGPLPPPKSPYIGALLPRALLGTPTRSGNSSAW